MVATLALIFSVLTSNLILHSLLALVWISLTIILLLDCNYNIFLDGITTFDVYYKVINVGIGVLVEHVSHDWFESVFDTAPNKNWLYAISCIIIFANILTNF